MVTLYTVRTMGRVSSLLRKKHSTLQRGMAHAPSTQRQRRNRDRVFFVFSSMNWARVGYNIILFLEGLGHNASGRSLVMTPE